VIGGKAKFKSINVLLAFVLVFSTACATSAATSSTVLQTARQSFLYLQKKVELKQCGDHKCLSHEMNSMASGFVIKVDKGGSYGVTAAHFCDTDVPSATPAITYKNFFTATSLDGDEYKATVLASDIDNDICLIYIKGLVDAPALKISLVAPRPGDKVYNIAAPRGIWQPHMVPLFQGIYDGSSGKIAFYSLPANPGSSGSMILNSKGELIGVLHSVYIRFPQIALSSRHGKLVNFIYKNIKKYETYQTVMKLLDLKDLFAPDLDDDSESVTMTSDSK
tara:strand:+ start:25105 stop:25938 length:834 start_codon:yes stop_codon:yes gene_type:complete